MCGIVGYAGFAEPGLLRRMCDSIAHRGPDGAGIVDLPQVPIAMGVRRLAIVDLVGGEQPFVSPDRRVHLVFNGEIYNFLKLRHTLEELGHRFKTRSDTEVVLTSYLQWGQDAWTRLQGMFALAIADMRGPAPMMIVVRDHVGMKPLYYAHSGGRIIFGSEIKALLEWAGMSRVVRLEAIRDYLALRYVPGPGCLIDGIQKLPAGHSLTFKHGTVCVERWHPPFQFGGRAADEAPAAAIGAQLRQAVHSHLMADVPVGAFLSGGLDSNLVVALMAEASSGPISTFSIGFPDFPKDELNRAALSARLLGTDHTAIECRAQDMTDLPSIVWALEEPVGDAIVVPLYALSREAHRKVKVVLTGEGADEIMGGYMFHRKLRQMARLRRLLPGAGWRLVAAVVAALPPALLDLMFDYPGRLGTEGRRKVAAMTRSLARDRLAQLYRTSISLFDPNDIEDIAASSMLVAAAQRAPGWDSEAAEDPHADALDQLIGFQFRDWLPDLILNKLDKLTMAHSLEARLPFMDKRVIATAAGLAGSDKLAGGIDKRPLRDFAATLLPKEIATAPKAAFYMPMESYVRSQQMRDVLSRTLDPERTRRRGLFKPQWAQRTLDAAREGGFLPLKRIFSIIMLELWFERFCPDASW